MIENVLYKILASDGVLAGYVTTYAGAPAVFSDEAPEDAAMPYIVFSSAGVAADHPAVLRFNVYIDYYDRQKSRVDSRRVGARLQVLLDQKIFSDVAEDYDNVRFYLSSDGTVPDSDPRVIHYNTQFEARAGRKAWAQNL